MQLPVFVEGWQIESATDVPPAVGDRVGWHLLFKENAVTDPSDAHGVIALAVSAQRYDREFSFTDFPTRLDAPGLALYWDAPGEVSGPVTVTGRISADWHDYVPLEFPRTSGVVLSIAIEYRQYIRVPSNDDPVGVWVQSSAEPQYEPVDTSPKWFDHPGIDSLRGTQTGILAIIELIDHLR